MSETIPIASDHAGVEMKDRLVSELKKLGYKPVDLGSKDPNQQDDYPDFAHTLAREVSTGEVKRGILLCGSGVGMDIVANRYPGVRAALAWEPEIGALSRRHNDSNVLVLPARFMSDDDAVKTMNQWLDTKFEGGRHERRVQKIDSEKP
ncbi:MAG TPA: RpiB/LacA/LacB family sugar-phosphate isomerase [Gemmatimonadaceae bacterium]|nr:RpiB/LacA/LacB family sugar-phosphate isomerase [Gemmatimonadaceae bacterium]